MSLHYPKLDMPERLELAILTLALELDMLHREGDIETHIKGVLAMRELLRREIYDKEVAPDGTTVK